LTYANQSVRLNGMTPIAAPPVRAERRGGLWHHRDFRRLWIGETVSQFGTMVSGLALPLVAILIVHATTFQIGALTACEYAAFALIGLPAGAWVDRLPMRPVLIVCDLVRLAALASIPLTAALGVLSIGQLFVVAFVTGVGTVFFDVAYMSYLPHLVDRTALVEGNAKMQASESVSQIAGPAIGGALIQALTAPYAILVDAASFLWSATWLSTIRTRQPRPIRQPDRHLGREIKEGITFVVREPMLGAITVCTSSSNLVSNTAMAVYFILLARDLHLPAGIIGLLTTTAAVGGLAGALLAPRIARTLGQGPTIWISALGASIGLLVLPFVHRDWTLALLAAAQATGSLCNVVYNITQVSFRQGLCPPQLLGRMNATIRFLVWGTIPIGALIGGILGTTIGVRHTLAVAAVASLLTFLPAYLSPLRTTRDLPSHQPTGP
jgi:MFS family permease